MFLCVSCAKRKHNVRKNRKQEHVFKARYMEKLLADHSILGIIAYKKTHPFTRPSRLIVLAVEVAAVVYRSHCALKRLFLPPLLSLPPFFALLSSGQHQLHGRDC